jgi:hypothetical protein
MLPTDRVLVAYVPHPDDFERIRSERWYRIPVRHAPKGIYAEWIAFYFGNAHAEWGQSIAYFAQNRGHELVRRRDLLPLQSTHPRAEEWYFKLQLGEVVGLNRPIVATQWKRILFLHTTGDRFQAARDLRDLLSEDEQFVARKLTTLSESAQPPYMIATEFA